MLYNEKFPEIIKQFCEKILHQTLLSKFEYLHVYTLSFSYRKKNKFEHVFHFHVHQYLEIDLLGQILNEYRIFFFSQLIFIEEINNNWHFNSFNIVLVYYS